MSFLTLALTSGEKKKIEIKKANKQASSLKSERRRQINYVKCHTSCDNQTINTVVVMDDTLGSSKSRNLGWIGIG